MAFNINDIKGALKLGGARGTLFQVQITNVANSVADNIAPFLIESTQLPSAQLSTIEVPYFGRRIKLAGDRSYGSWQVRVINDENFLVRNALEEWSNKINGFTSNIRNQVSYQSEAHISQYSKTGEIVRTYNFHNIWPSEIAPIDLDWSSTDIERFVVTFQYDYWTVDGATGNAGGNI